MGGESVEKRKEWKKNRKKNNMKKCEEQEKLKKGKTRNR